MSSEESDDGGEGPAEASLSRVGAGLSSIAAQLPELGRLTGLTRLCLHGNNIARLDDGGLSALGRLRELNLSSNLLERGLAALAPLTSLTALDLSANKLSDVSGLGPLARSLAALNLSYNFLADADGLAELQGPAAALASLPSPDAPTR